MKRLGNILAFTVPLCLIGGGLWAIYPPLGPIVVGALAWHDLREPGGGEE